MDKVLILDFGSQYTQLIARRIRELNVFCEIHPYDIDPLKIQEFKAKAIILSGGPNSVYELETPKAPNIIFDSNVPVLGICYGMQTLCEQLGGKVTNSDKREFGHAQIRAHGHSLLLKDIQDDQDYFNILRKIQKKPNSSQRELAKELGFSLGKLNYCLKGLQNKGLIKIQNFKRNPKKINYLYILTPKGISTKTRLTINFMKRKMQEYDQLKSEIYEQQQ